MIKSLLSALFILFGILEYFFWWSTGEGQVGKLLEVYFGNRTFLGDPYISIYLLTLGIMLSRDIREKFRDHVLNRVPIFMDNNFKKVVKTLGIALFIGIITSLFFFIVPLFLGKTNELEANGKIIFWLWIICPIILRFFIFNLPDPIYIEPPIKKSY
jgi:nitrate/nitrite transporter NarK